MFKKMYEHMKVIAEKFRIFTTLLQICQLFGKISEMNIDLNCLNFLDEA